MVQPDGIRDVPGKGEGQYRVARSGECPTRLHKDLGHGRRRGHFAPDRSPTHVTIVSPERRRVQPKGGPPDGGRRFLRPRKKAVSAPKIP